MSKSTTTNQITSFLSTQSFLRVCSEECVKQPYHIAEIAKHFTLVKANSVHLDGTRCEEAKGVGIRQNSFMFQMRFCYPRVLLTCYFIMPTTSLAILEPVSFLFPFDYRRL